MVDEIFQMEMKRIALVKERYLKRLMQYPNVIGVGVGFKEISGEEVRVPCIVVYVEEKVPVGSLKPEHVIPKSIEGIPTDVKVMKRPRALTLVSTEEKNPWTSKHRPCPAGVSVGEESITAGTLGNWSRIISNAYGRDLRGRIVGETNWHVLGEVKCRKGGRVLQPAPYDGGRVDRDLIGTILDFEKVETLGSGNCPFAKSAVEFLNWLARLVGSRHKFYTKVEVWNELDTGIFLVDDGDVLPEIYSIGVPKGVREATVGMTVQKSGRTTHHTTGGVIKDTHWSGQVMYSNGISLFKNQILIYKSGFSSGGDSGSTILDMDGYIVGRLFAGGGEWTIANHYTKILERYPIKPITEEDLR